MLGLEHHLVTIFPLQSELKATPSAAVVPEHTLGLLVRTILGYKMYFCRGFTCCLTAN